MLYGKPRATLTDKNIAILFCLCYTEIATQVNNYDIRYEPGIFVSLFPYVMETCVAAIGDTDAGRVFG